MTSAVSSQSSVTDPGVCSVSGLFTVEAETCKVLSRLFL